MPMPKHLNRIGLGVFISNYEYFASRPQRAEAIAHLMRIYKGKAEDGASHCFSGAKYLFDDPTLLREALEYIAYIAPKAKPEQKEKAAKLLKGL